MRYKTGQKCDRAGSFRFDGYTDGTTLPTPTAEERTIALTMGETFPPIRSASKAAWWQG